MLAPIVLPPDGISQLMLAIPMILLYEAGLIASRILAPRRAAGDDEPAAP